MASQTEIVNNALTALGADRVLSIDDDNENARTMRAVWALNRDAEQAAHPWAFAMARAALPALTEAPAFGFGNAYQLPTGYLSMVEVGEQWVMYEPSGGAQFAIEGQQILTDAGSPLRIRYVQRIETAGLFPPLFATALAMRLAMATCERLTQSSTKLEGIMALYKDAIRTARRQNAIERPPERIPESAWWLARV